MGNTANGYDWGGFLQTNPSADAPFTPSTFGRLLLAVDDETGALNLIGAEGELGNPASDGYVLSSTTAGVRSWVDIGALPDNGGQVYNVVAHGAAGDGVTDDGPVIQDLIDTVPLGSTVLIPGKTFLLNTVTAPYYLLKLRDKVSVVGVGPASVLKAGPGLRNSTTGLCILYNHTQFVSDLQIANLTIDYNGANNLVQAGWSGNALVNRTGGNIASGVMIRNVAFKNSAGHHFVWFGLNSADARNTKNSVVGCTFSECGLSISGNLTTDHSSIYMGGTNSVVANNSFVNSTQDYVATAIELHSDGTTAIGNTVVRYDHGVNLGGDANSVNNVSITGNTFKSVVRGLVLWTYSDYTIDNLNFSNNSISVVDTEGTAYSAGGGVVYEGNFDTSSATSTLWTIKGNNIRPENVNTASFAYTITGITINAVSGLVIEGNTISGMKAEGIRLGTVSGKAHSNVVIANNSVQSCGYTTATGRSAAIKLLSNAATNLITNAAVRGNVITAGHFGSASDMAYGISLNSTGQFDKLAIEGNSIRGAVTFDLNIPTNQTTTSKLFIAHVAEKTGTPLSVVRGTWGSRWIDSTAGTVYDFRNTAGTNGNADGWNVIPNLLGGTNLVEQRNGTNGQTFNLYNTFTDTGNYERAFLKWISNQLQIGTDNAGTGTARQLLLNSASSMFFATGGTTRWGINNTSAGVLFPNLTNTYDLGATTNTVRSGYFGTSVIVGGSSVVTVGDTGTVTDKMLNGSVKPAVAVVATSNLTLSGEQTIDGQLTSGSLVLCTAQTTGSQNGPWVTASGAWTRPTWYPVGGTPPQFSTTFVRLGTTYQGSTWRMTTASVTIGTTATTWVQTPTNLNSVVGAIAESSVTNLTTDLAAKAPLASPSLTGTPTAPTAASSTNTTQLATTAFVQAVKSDLLNGAGGAYDTLKELQDLIVADETTATALATAVSGKAPIASPTFTGTVTIPNGAALGTPASATLTNATGLPVSTGISGLGTGVATALAIATNASSGFSTNAVRTLYWEATNVANAADTNYVSTTAYSLPAGKMATDGDELLIEGVILLSSATSTRSFHAAIGYSSFSAAGGASGGLLLVGNSTTQASSMIEVRARVMRTGATTANYYSFNQVASSAQVVNFTSGSITWANAQNIIMAVKDGSSNAAAATIKDFRVTYRPR